MKMDSGGWNVLSPQCIKCLSLINFPSRYIGKAIPIEAHDTYPVNSHSSNLKVIH